MTDRRFFPAILFGVITILVIVLATSFIMSLLLQFTSYTESSFKWIILSFAFIAMFTGGMMSGAKAKGKGWMVGALTGLLFSLITFFIHFLGYDSTFTSDQYLLHAGYIIAATLGGIIGVNVVGGK